MKADNLNYKQVKQCIQSFIYGVNTPSRWGCVDTETEVLSTSGFKRYDELKEGDEIYTWKDGKLQLNRVNKVVVKPFKGKLHSYKAPGYHQLVTPTHRMLARTNGSEPFGIKHSEEIFSKKGAPMLPTAFSGSDLPDIPLSDLEIQLAAVYYAAGGQEYVNEAFEDVSIVQPSKKSARMFIEQVLNDCRLPFKTKTEGDPFHEKQTLYLVLEPDAKTILKITASEHGRIAPMFFRMSQRQAKLFLEAWASASGYADKEVLKCPAGEVADALQQICLLAGWTSFFGEEKGETCVYIRRQEDIIPSSREEVKYDGLVWCPNVDNGTAVFRKDGCVFISGQTQAPFTNVTLDWTVPPDLADQYAIVGGKEMPFKYKDCKKEMDMINKAFIEIMIEGDANGRGFQYPIPTYSITKDFDWSETENNKLLFEMTAKYGTPYFSNYVNSDMEPSDVRSMCCRLRLDLRELRKKSGGFFGSGESTGSVGVVTINMPRIAYLSKSEAEFYERLDHMMDIAARSLKIKRDVITKFMENGLYPYTKRYLGTFKNHFSTIGLVGMNEACLNACWLRENIGQPKAQQFAKDVLNHMRDRLVMYQEQYGDLYNLEATPAESTTYRLAKHDVARYPDIITAAKDGGTPFYTNSSHLPVDFTSDIFEALDLQDGLQTLYTSGTVFHAFLGEKLPNWRSAAVLVRRIAENYKLPYYTLSPTYSVCRNHGYLAGEHFTCPDCGEPAEVYSRITGYYRPVQNWNDGKAEEYKERKLYKPDFALQNTRKESGTNTAVTEEKGQPDPQESPSAENPEQGEIGELLLFTTKTCPNCKMVKVILDKANVPYTVIDAEESPELVEKYDVSVAPTLLVKQDGLCWLYQNMTNIRRFLSKLGIQ